jgi:hypothetical protein
MTGSSKGDTPRRERYDAHVHFRNADEGIAYGNEQEEIDEEARPGQSYVVGHDEEGAGEQTAFGRLAGSGQATRFEGQEAEDDLARTESRSF